MDPYNTFCDVVFGPCVYSLPNMGGGPNLYLTFDDGPVVSCTEPILDLLEKHQAAATFFVIGERADKNRDLVRRISTQGHAIGDHSSDHSYSRFFRSRSATHAWIRDSYEALGDILGENPVGFRSPSGVRTPEVHAALRDLDIPLLHWNVRFFDSVRSWKQKAAQASVKRLRDGDIVLLHDTGRRDRNEFLKTLEFYIEAAKSRGFVLSKLPNLKPGAIVS
jgi:peptidoglycan-N-acetylglucosamine deacetylase